MQHVLRKAHSGRHVGMYDERLCYVTKSLVQPQERHNIDKGEPNGARSTVVYWSIVL